MIWKHPSFITAELQKTRDDLENATVAQLAMAHTIVKQAYYIRLVILREDLSRFCKLKENLFKSYIVGLVKKYGHSLKHAYDLQYPILKRGRQGNT